MAFEIRYTRLAQSQLKALRAFDRSAVITQIDNVLKNSTTLTSKARIKRLRQPAPTDFRLRVGEFRVFYNVADDIVQIIQIMTKADSVLYYQEQYDDAPNDDKPDDAHP